MKSLFPFFIVAIFSIIGCSNNAQSGLNKIVTEKDTTNLDTIIYPGIYQTQDYLSMISGKRIGVVSNQTGEINGVHLVDTLLSMEQNVVKVFCPEHGFRGDADAGATIANTTDVKTGLPIISLYGKNKKPSTEQLSDIDILIFDLQDVGVRFYTYISTLHYVMEACAESNVPVILLDRPNPNAHFIDGAILDTLNYRSFIGMHPVPVVYGMTIGEYGMMINGEKWLRNEILCKLTVIPCKNYSHDSKYSLPVKPSPNLPNDRSVKLYPSICFFEATNLSLGRGTDKQFQVLGHPSFAKVALAEYSFTPKPNQGASDPVLNGKLCYGFDLSADNSIFEWNDNQLNIGILIKTYQMFPDKTIFFKKTNSIELLSGYAEFRSQIENGMSEDDIRKTWQPGIEKFKLTRLKYLIYE